MDRFAPSMRKKYKCRLINRENQWPPRHSNKLVRLELVEREKGESRSTNMQRGREEKSVKRKTLAYVDLFKEESGKERVRKILVEGVAGIGKTTLSVSLSEDWACGELFQEFELLLLLSLRQKEVASAGSLTELLKPFHSDQEVCESVAKYLEKEEAEKVLVIADGWDELSQSKRREESFLYQLLFKMFPFMSVVLTSRPSASAPLHSFPCIDRFVEVNGFGKDDIKEYIQSDFISDHNKGIRLSEQLEYNPLIENVCSIPLNCVIVCHLWHTLDEALPSTVTQLYTKLVLYTVCRNLRKLDAYGPNFGLNSFDELPVDLKQSWWLLCQFACEALEKNEIVFSKKELLQFFPQSIAFNEKILCFGLLQTAETIIDVTCVVSFNFVHLTFMEYLAALYLSRKPSDRWLQLLEKPHFTMVARFLFGFCFSASKSVSKDLDIKQVLQSIADTDPFVENKLALCHCAFEAQNHSINDAVIQFLMECNPSYFGVGFGHPHTAHDCAAILYIIGNLQECSGLKIDFSSCGISENQIRTLAGALANKLQVKRLDLSCNKLTDKIVCELFQKASAAFQSLKIIYLNGNFIGAESIKSITTAFVKSSCTRYGLSLSDNPLGVSGQQALRNAVCDYMLSELLWLDLSRSLPSDADSNASLVEALSAHCPYLEALNLSHNKLGSTGATALARGISRFQHLRPRFWSKVYLNGTNFGDETICAFVDNMDNICYIKELELMDNGIHGTGVSCLADAVCSGKIVFKDFYSNLDLSDNPLGLEGTLALGRMLSSTHCKLRMVHLSRCELINAGGDLPNTETQNIEHVGQQLWQMPRSNTITSLDCCGNIFTGEGILILAGFMHLCTSLTYLFSRKCGITSDDLKRLFDKLKSSSSGVCIELTSWDLDDNKIDNSGVSAIVDHLQSLFPCLGSGIGGAIDLSNNPVCKEMKKVLKEELKKHHKVRY